MQEAGRCFSSRSIIGDRSSDLRTSFLLTWVCRAGLQDAEFWTSQGHQQGTKGVRVHIARTVCKPHSACSVVVLKSSDLPASHSGPSELP